MAASDTAAQLVGDDVDAVHWLRVLRDRQEPPEVRGLLRRFPSIPADATPQGGARAVARTSSAGARRRSQKPIGGLGLPVFCSSSVSTTRDGKAVAELRPLPRPRATAAALIERFRRLPPVDPQRFRTDVDASVDQSL